MATTQTASAMLKEITALETFSETTCSSESETIVLTYVPFRVDVMATTIKIEFDSRRNGKSDGSILEMTLKPSARVWKSLLKSGIRINIYRWRYVEPFVPAHTLQELKEHLLDAARYEKLKALTS